MKKLYLLTTALLLSCLTHAQVAYYDAISLSESLIIEGTSAKFPDDDPEALSAICAVLANYYPALEGETVEGFINAVASKEGVHGEKYYNVFLDRFFSDTLRQSEIREARVGATAGGIPGLDVSVVARGVAEFLVKRATEELFISIVEKLNDPQRYPEIPLLFPNTKLLLDSFNSWQYSNITNTLKAALEKDMQDIMANLPKLANLNPDDYKDKMVHDRVTAIVKFFKSPDARLYISALAVGDGLIKSRKIPDILHVLSTDQYLTGMPNASPDFINTLKLVDMLSHSVRSNQIGRNYISAADFAVVKNNANARDLYLGLLYAKMQSGGITFSNMEASQIVNRIYAYMEQLLTAGEHLDSAVQNLQEAKKRGEKDLTSYWASLFEAANKAIATLANVTSITPRLSIPRQLQQVISYSTKSIDIANDIALHNYSAAIVDVISMIPTHTESKGFRKFFVKYGSFAANVIQAKNAEDFSNALESFALPVGSYTIKQRSYFNVSLNGYVGYALDLNGGLSHGVYAPIGFSGSWGLCGGKKNSGALSLFAGIVDLGSIVAYNVNNDNVDHLKHEIRLESIFSPSFQLLYQFGRTPITLGAGWRRTPKLFYEDTTDFIVVPSKNVLNFSVLIDIPLLTLHNKPFERM